LPGAGLPSPSLPFTPFTLQSNSARRTRKKRGTAHAPLDFVCRRSDRGTQPGSPVAKNLKAKGGAEKWKSISSVKMTGTFSAQGMEMPMTVYAKRPNLSRQDITIQDRRLVQAFDGVTPWTMAPDSDEPREIKGPQADAMRSGADFDGPLMDYATKGHKLELVGKEKVGATEVHHLKLTKKDGGVEHYYLDTDSGIEVKRTAEIDAGGMKQSLETELSNFKPIDGIMIPHTMKQSMNGSPVAQMRVEKIEFNAPIDDALFKMPVKK
jgi:outer membrane lipoprotein-sorting protein